MISHVCWCIYVIVLYIYIVISNCQYTIYLYRGEKYHDEPVHRCRPIPWGTFILFLCCSSPSLFHFVPYTPSSSDGAHFSMIGYIYPDTVCHDTIHDTICYTTTKQEWYCYWIKWFIFDKTWDYACHLMSCLWVQKSVQLTSLVGSMHVCVVSTILNIMLNTAQYGFFLSLNVWKIAVRKD